MVELASLIAGASLFRVWLSKMQRLFSFDTLINSAQAQVPQMSYGKLRIGLQFVAVTLFAAIFFPAMVMHLVRVLSCFPGSRPRTV